MNKLDCPDVNAACRLRNEQQLWLEFVFTPDDQLLLITTRKSARRKSSVWRTNIKVLDDLCSTSLNGVLVKALADQDLTRAPPWWDSPSSTETSNG